MDLHADERGTASVEIVVMLPVFIVLFFAGFYVHRAATSAEETGARARACAWQMALGGCANEAPLCAGMKPSSGATSNGGDGATTIDELARWPVLGEAVEALFGESVAARDSAVVANMGGGSSEVSREIYLVCNPVPASWDKKLKDVVCHVAKKTGIRMCE